ncbi:MAG: hypothetical protein ACR2MO_17220, partial [Acidimicrobiales bacterium]
MGWCHEFGSSIRHGCDEPMVAGEDSCSCSACGIRCTGKFVSCDLVWARGPRRVVFVRPLHGQDARGPIAAPALASGSPPDAPLLPPEGMADVEWLATTLEGVRADVRALRAAVEQQAGLLEAAHDLAGPPARLVELVEGLPERIGVAVSRAVGSAVAEQAASPQAAAPPGPPESPPPPAPAATPPAPPAG